MTDSADAIYEVRVLIHTDRPLNDDEQRAIGDKADEFSDQLHDVLVYDLGIDQSSVDVEAHGPQAVIA